MKFGMTEQRIFFGRLFDEHVEGCAGDMPAVERGAQRNFIHQSAAGAVDDAHALFGLGQVFRREDVAGLRGERSVQGDEIGARQELVEFDLFDSDFGRALGAQKRVVGDHPHSQSDAARGGDRADVAAADDAERLAGELHAHEAILLPLARLRRDVCSRDLPGEREHERDRVLGRGDRVAERRVHDDHAARCGGRNVDVVDADAGPADDLQSGRALQQFGGDLGRRPDRQTVVFADDLGEFVLVQPWFDVDFDASFLEDGDGGGGKLVGNENARSHGESLGVGGVRTANAGKGIRTEALR